MCWDSVLPHTAGMGVCLDARCRSAELGHDGWTHEPGIKGEALTHILPTGRWMRELSWLLNEIQSFSLLPFTQITRLLLALRGQKAFVSIIAVNNIY